MIQIGNNFKISPVQPAQGQSELQGQTGLLRALSSWILENLKDEDSITGLGSILLPSLSLSSLSFQKQEPYLSG